MGFEATDVGTSNSYLAIDGTVRIRALELGTSAARHGERITDQPWRHIDNKAFQSSFGRFLFSAFNVQI
ncbi:MAG: hypothetical protein H0X42_12175 [Solirubrobacterales bacterium]|nr:hypothetical protein [Solirubrobacterales bacterium]